MKKRFLLPALLACATASSTALATPTFYAPWTCGDSYVVSQVPGYGFSHNDQWNMYAWDIAMGVGTPILAPASGTVQFAVSGYGPGACDASYADRANLVIICFPDNSAMGFYHLQDVTVTPGQTVQAGQLIGHSGNSGYVCGPHLHFSAMESCARYSPSAPSNWIMGNPSINQTVTSDNCGEPIPQPEDEILLQAMMYDPQNTDINGDGKADMCARAASGLLCAISNGNGFEFNQVVLDALTDVNGWNDPLAHSTIRFADINGDKKADVCVRSDDGIDCWLSNGSTMATKVKTLSALSNGNGYNYSKYISTIRYADINGDGKDDVCARMKDKFRCYLSTGSSFDKEVSIDDLGDATGWDNYQYGSTIRMADVDGDGKKDMCARGLNTVYCWFSNGTSWSNEVEMQSGSNAWSDANGWGDKMYYSTIRFADINGDGKADICARDAKGVVCQLSNGRKPFGNTIRGPEWSSDFTVYDLNNYSTTMYGDLNGDGKDDVCMRTDKNLACALSTGSGFGKEYKIDFFGDANGQDTKEYFRTLRMGDLNGDGKMDVCARSNNGIKCFTFNGNGFSEVKGSTPEWSDAGNWNNDAYYPTVRFGGLTAKPAEECKPSKEICDGKDNDCDGQIDEDGVCDAPTPTCTPSQEICDGKDNDCDGQIDEDGVCDIPSTCVPSQEICDGKDNDCDGQIDEDGVCDVPGACVPSQEICDNKDNDCDGLIDEDGVCDVPGACRPSQEICDGIDNDCDGQIDEDGVCNAPGSCVPSQEICDGKDNDCDGQIDEDGVCNAPGSCVPSQEICDGKDNDCDGQVDEDGVCDSKGDGDTCTGDNCDQDSITANVESGCSMNSKPNSPSGLLALFGMLSAFGMMRLRRRRED